MNFASSEYSGNFMAVRVCHKWKLARAMLTAFAFLLSMMASFAASGDEYWDGVFGVPGADGPVYTIVSAGSEIYFGGRFSQIGGTDATNLAKWNGRTWAPVGGGITGGTFPN